jgi:anti-sigma factor RsiW
MTVYPAGHVTPKILADHAERLLSAEDEAAVRAHLDSCAACRQVAADLRDVSVLLAADVAPRMPADIAARLEDTLGAEPPLTAAPPRQHATVPAAPPRARSRTRRMPVWVGAAAAAVLGVTGAVLGVRALDDGDTEASSTAGAALEADRAAEATESALAAPADGDDYTAATLEAQVAALVARTSRGAQEDAAGDDRQAAPGTVPGAEGTVAEPAPPTRNLSALSTLATPEGLAACVASLTGGQDVTPIAVDLASFDKQPAAIIVLPDPSDPETLDVRVVGARCSATDDDLILATRVPRP